MPKQCATGPQYGAMPDPWSPAVLKYINDGLDDETLGAPTEAQPPSSLEETVDGIKNGTSTGATLNMDGTTYQGVEGLAVGVNSVKPPLTAEELTTGKVEKFRQRFIAGHKPWEKIGIFKFPEDTKVSIDFSLVIPKNHLGFAKKLGTYTRQHSIYDFETKDLIELGFSGKDNRNLTPQELTVVREIIENLNQEPNSPKDIQEAETILDYIVRNDQHSLNTNIWRKIQSADSSQRKEAMQQDAKLLDAAILVREGKMTVPNFRKLVQKYNPIEPITEVPPLSSLLDVVRALDKGKAKGKRIVGLPNVLIKDGESVGFRLDIPAYRDYDIWVNAIHRKGQKNMYSNASVGINAVFGNNSKQALKVATGTAKSPFAVIDVEWQNQSIEQTKQEIAEALQDSQQPNSTWKQIGMNPNRSGYFYDKATFLPVASASRVLQLGPLVMAQNVQYVPTKEANVNFNPRDAKELEAKQEAVFTVISQQDIAKQKKLNLFLDDEFVRETSVGTVLSLKDSVQHDQRIQGVFMNRLLDNMNTKALNHIKNWGVPALVIHGDSFKGKSAFYRPTDDLIFVRKTPRINKIDQKPNQKDLEITALHEYGHFVHNRLEEMRTGASRFTDSYYNPKEFKDAIERDAISLGMKIYIPEFLKKDLRYQTTLGDGSGMVTTLKLILDDYMNDFVTYNHLLHNPSVREELIAKLKAIEERPIGSNVFPAAREQAENRKKQEASRLIWAAGSGTGSNKLPTGVKYYETFNRNYSKDLEAYHHTHRTIPTPSEMLRKIEEIHNKKAMVERPLNRILKYRNKILERHLAVYNTRASKEYLRGFYDILDAMTIGAASDMGLPGHDALYFSKENNPEAEIFANVFEAYSNKDQRAYKYMKKEIPLIIAAFERIMNTNRNKKWTSQNELDSTTRHLFNEGG